MVQDYREYLAKILVSEEQIQQRVKELGQQISRDYAGKNLLVVCILRGGVMFLTDLIRQIEVPLAIEFMAVSSYGSGARQSDGEVRITLDLRISITGKDVLIVEDIIDSGNTLSSVIEILQTRNPNSVYVCTLLDKFERREVDVPIRYCGFQINNEFVFGYGLDMDEYYRNLPFVGVVDLDKYEPPQG
ncbi:MAG: hypoxanthine phosphoribosyltransferase [Anaerolineaceae bacterium]|jgi:hypoxanthine phosphoribosyltransferase|nr:hypoxanthine phosphoribosyltransferase [Anaerolineaceae bacterium]MDD4043332.1 hypoxanthine phosphoribosyltransferase [Anaerolineaceae bacterium]